MEQKSIEEIVWEPSGIIQCNRVTF